MPTHITLIRHGETEWNAARRYQGHAPVPLSDTGRQQAQLAARHLYRARIDRIVSSDLPRARETAEIIANVLQLPVTLDARFREINVGNWQGLSHDEILAWDAEAYAAYHHAPYTQRQMPGGESQQQVNARVLAGLEEIAPQLPDQHVLVVTHGGVIRGLTSDLGEADHLVGVPNCSLTRLRYLPDAPRWDILCLSEDAETMQW